MRILITGIAGFAGSHLAEYALNQGARVYGIEFPGKSLDNLFQIKDKVKVHFCNLNNAKKVFSIIKAVKPNKIFHLAAQSSVSRSWDSAKETIENNIFGQFNILESVKQLKLDCTILVIGSAEEYGNCGSKRIKETEPLKPGSPYALSKVAQDYMALQYCLNYGIKTIRVRSFNHIGPRQSESFAISNFAKQIALIESGKQSPVIKVGNLNAIRDFSDVRDVVRAYWLATEKCKSGEVYNICSAKGYKIKEVLDMLIRLSSNKVRIKKDPKRMRPSDTPVLIGDNSKFSKQTGWKPKEKFEQTLSDLLNYWRETIRIFK